MRIVVEERWKLFLETSLATSSGDKTENSCVACLVWRETNIGRDCRFPTVSMMIYNLII
jgi:hypothetical protein